MQCSRFPRALDDIATHSGEEGSMAKKRKTKAKAAAKKGAKKTKRRKKK